MRPYEGCMYGGFAFLMYVFYIILKFILMLYGTPVIPSSCVGYSACSSVLWVGNPNYENSFYSTLPYISPKYII